MQLPKISHLIRFVRTIVLLFVVLSVIIVSEVDFVYAGQCEDALGRCLADGAPLVIEPGLYAAWAAFCGNGYLWCKRYFE